MLAPQEFKDIHPLGKSPIISIESDSTSKPLVLAESGYIIEYLIDHFGPWLSPDRYAKGKEGEVGGETEGWLRYRYFMHYVEGSLMPLLVMSLVFNSKLVQHIGSIRGSTDVFCSPENTIPLLHKTNHHDAHRRSGTQFPTTQHQQPS